LDALLDAGLIRSAGHREVPGRPTLWATTPQFLQHFGLNSVKDLPRKEELTTEQGIQQAEERSGVLPLDPVTQNTASPGGDTSPNPVSQGA
jgi:segregation and condensation protein B